MGNWCAGVTSAAAAAGSASVRSPPASTSTGDELEPGAMQDRAVLPEARLLDEHAARPAGAQQAGEQRDRLGDPGADDDVLRGGDHAARAAEVGGEARPQARRAGPRAVAEVGVGRGSQRAAHRGQPRAARERSALGRLRAQVEADRGDAGDRRGRRARRRRARPSPRAWPTRGARRGSPRRRAARRPPPPRRGRRRARPPARASTAGRCRRAGARRARRRAAAPRAGRAAACGRSRSRTTNRSRPKWSTRSMAKRSRAAGPP